MSSRVIRVIWGYWVNHQSCFSKFLLREVREGQKMHRMTREKDYELESDSICPQQADDDAHVHTLRKNGQN